MIGDEKIVQGIKLTIKSIIRLRTWDQGNGTSLASLDECLTK